VCNFIVDTLYIYGLVPSTREPGRTTASEAASTLRAVGSVLARTRHTQIGLELTEGAREALHTTAAGLAPECRRLVARAAVVAGGEGTVVEWAVTGGAGKARVAVAEGEEGRVLAARAVAAAVAGGAQVDGGVAEGARVALVTLTGEGGVALCMCAKGNVRILLTLTT